MHDLESKDCFAYAALVFIISIAVALFWYFVLYDPDRYFISPGGGLAAISAIGGSIITPFWLIVGAVKRMRGN